MGLVRYIPDDGPVRPGYIIDGTVFDLTAVIEEGAVPLPELDGLAERIVQSDEVPSTPLDSVTLDIPTRPATIVRLEGCYEHDVTDTGFDPHMEDAGFNDMATPSLWVMPRSTLAATGEAIRIPSAVEDVRPGVELGLVVGRSASGLEPHEALDTIAGITVCMDVAAYDDLPGLEGYKMYETFLPCGPSLVPTGALNPERVALGVRRNGDTVDIRSTGSFRFGLGEIVSYVSKVLTLRPGDLITTGSPVRDAPTLAVGDEVEAWIESVGRLEMTVHVEEAT